MYSTAPDLGTVAATPPFTPPPPQAVPQPQQPLIPMSTPASKQKALQDVLSNLASGKQPVGQADQGPTVGKPPQPGSNVAKHVDATDNPFAPGGQYYGVDPNLVGQSHQQQQAVDQASKGYDTASSFDPGAPPQYAAPEEKHPGRLNTLAAILGGLALLAGPGYKGSGIGNMFSNFETGLQKGRSDTLTRKDAEAKEKFEADSDNYKNKIDLDKFRSSAAFDKFNMAKSQLDETDKQVEDQHKFASDEHDKALERKQLADQFAKTYGLDVQQLHQRQYEYNHLSKAQQDAHNLSVLDLKFREKQEAFSNQLALAHLAVEKQIHADEQAYQKSELGLHRQELKDKENPNSPLNPFFKQVNTFKTAQLKKIPDQLKAVATDLGKTSQTIVTTMGHDPKFFNPTTQKWTPAAADEYRKRQQAAMQVASDSYDKIVLAAGRLGADIPSMTNYKDEKSTLSGKLKDTDIETGMDSSKVNPAVVGPQTGQQPNPGPTVGPLGENYGESVVEPQDKTQVPNASSAKWDATDKQGKEVFSDDKVNWYYADGSFAGKL